MNNLNLPRKEWKDYCDRSSKKLSGKNIRVEVISIGLGDQILAKSLPLLGITYDPKDDVLEIAMNGLDHLIVKPTEILVVEENGVPSSLEIIDSEGQRQILTVIA